MQWISQMKSRVLDVFRGIDRDQDGRISQREFIESVLSSSECPRGWAGVGWGWLLGLAHPTGLPPTQSLGKGSLGRGGAVLAEMGRDRVCQLGSPLEGGQGLVPAPAGLGTGHGGLRVPFPPQSSPPTSWR